METSDRAATAAGTFSIGELAATAGVNVETIRYYERTGLLPEPPRTASGYRQYHDEDLWRLAFIQRGKRLGFTLREIGELLADEGSRARSLGEVTRIAAQRLARVERELDRLVARREQLRQLIDVCAAGSEPGCLDLHVASDGTRGEPERGCCGDG